MLHNSNSYDQHRTWLNEECSKKLQEARQAIEAPDLARAARLLQELDPFAVDLPDRRAEIEDIQEYFLSMIAKLMDSQLESALDMASQQNYVAARDISAQWMQALNELIGMSRFVRPVQERLFDMISRVEVLNRELAAKLEQQERQRQFPAVISFEFQMEPHQQGAAPQPLTPQFLTSEVAPYLDAIADLQNVIDLIHERSPSRVLVRSLSHWSPISVSLDGAPEAIKMILEVVVPWRRKHAKTLAQLEEQEKLIQIERLKAEVVQIQANAQRERSEANRNEVESDSRFTQARLDKLLLEREHLRLDLEQKRIGLVLEVMEKQGSNLDEDQRLMIGFQLMRPLGVLRESPLLIAPPSNGG